MRPVLVRGIDGVFRPSEVAFTDDGTDLRDDVARAVFLMSLAAVQTTEPDYVAITGFERLAQDAYAAADAMLKARKHGLAEDPNKKGAVACKLTNWFPMSVQPVRPGVYKVMTIRDVEVWSRWDGQRWYMASPDHGHAQQSQRPSAWAVCGQLSAWRGLAEDPSPAAFGADARMSRQDITGSQIVEAIRTHCGVSLQEAGAALRAYTAPKQDDRAAFRDRAFLAAITGLCAAPDRPREVAEEALRIAVQATTLRESFK